MELPGVTQLIRVHPTTAAMVWMQVGPRLDEALAFVDGEYDLEAVFGFIQRDEWQLWALVKNDVLRGVMTSEIVQYAKKCVCRIILAQGDPEAVEEVLPQFEEWALGCGASALEAFWRPGISRKYAKIGGFTIRYHVGVKSLSRRMH